MAKMYGIGAAIVIIGAMFKINHYPGASEMLVVGLSTEAIIFFFSAFEPPHEDPDWSLVYPELAIPADGPKPPTRQLDDMLAKANIDEELINNLGEGMRHLGDQAAKMSEAVDVGVAAQDYSDSLSEASDKVKQLAGSYEQASESLTGLKDAGEMSETVGAAMKQMTNNLGSLNEMYADQLKQLEVNSELYKNMGSMVQNLSDSVEDTKAYKENIAHLAENLASLNTVYANMLNAMGK